MTLTRQQQDEMLNAAQPLMSWLLENCHPHCVIMVENDSVELLESIAKSRKAS